MKILVTAKRVEDPESKIKVKPDGAGIVLEGLKYKINPFDEIAVEEALRLVAKVESFESDAEKTKQPALALQADGKTLRVVREVDGGLCVLDCTLPCVVTTDLRLNQPRYASLPGIMKAKSKPIEELTPAGLGV